MSTTVADEPASLNDDEDILRALRDTRKPYQKQLAVYLILASTLFERLAFYSLSSNLVVYLKSDHLNWNSKESLTAVNIFYGVSYAFGIVFAIISDAKLGRALTISIGFVIYLIGYIFLTIIAQGTTQLCPCLSDRCTATRPSLFGQPCSLAIVLSLICTAIGASAVQVNAAVFGVEQTRDLGTKSRYFDKYMIIINVGSIPAIFLPSIHRSDVPDYFIPYLVSVSMLVFSMVLFVIGIPHYTHVKPYDTIVLKCFPVVFNAFRTWFRYKKHERSVENFTGEESGQRAIGFLDYAKTINHGRFHEGIVDDVKSLRNALVVFTLLIPYWLVYDQRDAAFHLQGEHMNTYDYPQLITWVSLGELLVIIFGLLILNVFGYKYMDKHHRTMSITTKFIIGMILGCVTMGVTGAVEIVRQTDCNLTDVSSLSIAFQMPQYVGTGLSEIFFLVASYEYAYFCAPRSAASLFMSLRFCSIGLSSFLNTAVMNVFPSPSFEISFSCLADKQQQWSFYTYFFILGAALFLSMIVVIVCQKRFKIIRLNSQKLQHNHHSSTSVNSVLF